MMLTSDDNQGIILEFVYKCMLIAKMCDLALVMYNSFVAVPWQYPLTSTEPGGFVLSFFMSWKTQRLTSVFNDPGYRALA